MCICGMFLDRLSTPIKLDTLISMSLQSICVPYSENFTSANLQILMAESGSLDRPKLRRYRLTFIRCLDKNKRRVGAFFFISFSFSPKDNIKT